MGRTPGHRASGAPSPLPSARRPAGPPAAAGGENSSSAVPAAFRPAAGRCVPGCSATSATSMMRYSPSATLRSPKSSCSTLDRARDAADALRGGRRSRGRPTKPVNARSEGAAKAPATRAAERDAMHETTGHGLLLPVAQRCAIVTGQPAHVSGPLRVVSARWGRPGIASRRRDDPRPRHHRRAAQWSPACCSRCCWPPAARGPRPSRATAPRPTASSEPRQRCGCRATMSSPSAAVKPDRPYEVLGRNYVPMTQDRAFGSAGLASWYGAVPRPAHGQRREPTCTR